MRVHDYHLRGYDVSNFGGEIVLHLELDEKDQSRILFSDVAAYHFIHTGGTIIFDIEEISIAHLLDQMWVKMAEWWRLHDGFAYWNDDRDQYRNNLQTKGYKAWSITSSVGFEGFVIAKSVAEIPVGD